MLIIRETQMTALEHAAVQNFKRRALKHLKEHAPVHCRILGEEGIRNTIDYGMQRAEGYGFTTERSLLIYLDLMFLLCRDFDIEPQLPWAKKILEDTHISHESIRIDRLQQKAFAYIKRVDGPDNKYLLETLRKVRQEPLDRLLQVLHNTDNIFSECLIALLKYLYPEKCNYLGGQGLHQLIQNGSQSARGFDITGERGLVLCVGLIFLLGTHFVNDPLFYWAGDILNDQKKLEAEKVNQLYIAAMKCLEQWLQAP